MGDRVQRLFDVGEGGPDWELQRLVEEQTALRRVATLVATGASDIELVAQVTSEIAHLFGADRATALRWEGDTLRVVGHWGRDETPITEADRLYTVGGDTLTARVIESGSPARVESVEDLHTDFACRRYSELGIQTTIGAPVIVDGQIWGVITASRTTPDHLFPEGAEFRLGDFAALVAQAIANSAARQEVAALASEQAALRRVATLVAGGRPQAEVLAAAAREAGEVFAAGCVCFVRSEGIHGEVLVVGGWCDGNEPGLEPGSLFHPAPGGATLSVLETGFASRSDNEASPELGARYAIAAPVIVSANLDGALVALRPSGAPFDPGAEVRLRSFGDLLSQSIANERAQEEMRASRARIVHAADEARRTLERNLHDGAQQRLVSVSLSLRLATTKLPEGADDARKALTAASEELAVAIDELRELARGIHPAVLTREGLGVALEVLGERAPLPVEVTAELDERLPPAIEAAGYYVVAESLTNIVKYAEASKVDVRVFCRDGVVRVEVVDDGIGGADMSRGSGLRGLADRVEALDGRLGVESPPSRGTRMLAEIPLG